MFPYDDEGELSRKLIYLVRRETLVSIALKINLGPFIFLSESEISTGGRTKASNLENVLEAIVAAIFFDGGFTEAKLFVEKHWFDYCPSILTAPKNPKNILQEITQNYKMDPPIYEIVEKIGPDHNPFFKVRVSVLAYGQALGEGKTVKIAEQHAAEELLKLISLN